jgi:hypothetical protein
MQGNSYRKASGNFTKCSGNIGKDAFLRLRGGKPHISSASGGVSVTLNSEEWVYYPSECNPNYDSLSEDEKLLRGYAVKTVIKNDLYIQYRSTRGGIQDFQLIIKEIT